MKNKRYELQNGQGLVEFALLLPVLVLFLLVIFDLGRATYYYSACHNAAAEGARYASVHWNDGAGITQAAKRLTAGINATVSSPSFFDQDADGNSDIVTITVNCPFQAATPILGRLLGAADNTILLHGKATMRLER